MRLTIGTVQIEANDAQDDVLAVTFDVTKNLKAEPNKVEIKVWNLAAATRKALETPKVVTVKLEVGYQREPHTIFLGQLRGAVTERDGPDLITTISSGDSEDAFGFGRNVQTIPAKLSAAQLLQFAAQGLRDAGVNVGNLKSAQDLASVTFGPATKLRGNAADVMDRVTRANGMEWSVQDGALQILKIGAALSSQAVELSSDDNGTNTGLIGIPSVDTKGIMKCKSVIQPDLEPGRTIVMNAENVKGAFRIEESQYKGETWGDDWYVELTCRKWQMSPGA